MPFIATERLTFYAERSDANADSAPQLLFLCGVCGDLRNKPNIFDKDIAQNFDLLAFDQRGTGRTDKPDTPYQLLDYVDDAVALLDHYGWDTAHVMGVSFGGMVAQELAIRHPERVDALVLACTTAGGKGGSSYPLHKLIGLDPDIRARKMMAIGDMRRNEEWQQANPKEAAELLAMSANTASPFLAEDGGQASYERQIWARSQHNAYDRLPLIKAKTYIAAGRYDGQAKLENVEKLHEQIPNSELHLFEGGHAFLAQDPTAYPAINNFLISQS